MRSKPELVAENALLRQQLIVLDRSVKRPTLTRSDRVLLLLLASRVGAWRQALLTIKPDTLLRWHRAGFRIVWRNKSTVTTRTPRVPAETVALIAENGGKFGAAFARMAAISGIEVLRTPYRAPRANAICERFGDRTTSRRASLLRAPDRSLRCPC